MSTCSIMPSKYTYRHHGVSIIEVGRVDSWGCSCGRDWGWSWASRYDDAAFHLRCVWLWYGVVWCGVVWCGMKWHDGRMVWSAVDGSIEDDMAFSLMLWPLYRRMGGRRWDEGGQPVGRDVGWTSTSHVGFAGTVGLKVYYTWTDGRTDKRTEERREGWVIANHQYEIFN